MDLTIGQLAEAFSHHSFEETYPYILDTIQWNLIGDKLLQGKEEVIKACTESAAYLAQVTTRFSKFKTVIGANTVVIDSLAEYIDAEHESATVASCDIYDFTDGKLSAITSYTIALDND